MAGPDLGRPPTPRCSRTPLLPEHLGDVVVRLVGERPEQRVAEVDEVDLRRARPRGRGTRRSSSSWIRSASAPATSTPVGPPPTIDEVQRALVDQRRVAVGVLEDAEDPRAQPLRVVERVEREGVLRGARGAEEVRLRAGGEDERVAGEASRRRSVVTRAASPGRPTATSASLTSTLCWSCEQLAQRVGDVARAPAARSPPGRAAAGTGGSCCGRSA